MTPDVKTIGVNLRSRFKIPSRTLFALILIFCLDSTPVTSADKMNSPFSSLSTKPVKLSRETSTTKVILKGLIKAYSRVISPADGPRSPSYPTGSAYGIQAIETHGFFPGIVLIADRLIHESDIHPGSSILKYGRLRYFDPLKHNTYWWDLNQVE